MFGLFRKKQEVKEKYKIKTTKVKDIVYRYDIEIMMENGDIFKTKLFDDFHEGKNKIDARKYDIEGVDNRLFPFLEMKISYIYRNENLIHTNNTWKIDTNLETSIILNSNLIAYIKYTKTPERHVLLVNDTMVSIEDV